MEKILLCYWLGEGKSNVFKSESLDKSTTPQGTPIHPGIFGQYKLALEEKEDIR